MSLIFFCQSKNEVSPDTSGKSVFLSHEAHNFEFVQYPVPSCNLLLKVYSFLASWNLIMF